MSARISAEQQARNMLERMGVPDAQSYSASDLIELANLIAERNRARAEAAAPPTVYEWVVRVGDHWLASGSGPILERVEEEANYWLQYTHTGVGMAQIRAVQIIKEITP